MNQDGLVKLLATFVSEIGRYERDEITPSIEVAKKIAVLLSIIVSYLLGETQEANIFKDPQTLERFNAISSFQAEDQEKIFFTLDALIHEVRNRRTYARK